MHSYFRNKQIITPVKGSCARRMLKKSTAVLHLLLVFLTLVSTTPAYGEVNGKQQSSDSNVNTQAIKNEAIELISRLHRLEHQLFYPAHTHVSVFLSIAENSQVKLHSVSLKMDRNNVTDHIYTQKEIHALDSGGIQRLYTGNVLIGKHKLQVSVRQVKKDGSVRSHKLEHKFTKDENAENIEIIIDRNKPHIIVQSRN